MHLSPLKSKKFFLLLTTFLISSIPLKALPGLDEEQKIKKLKNVLLDKIPTLNSSEGREIVILLGKTGSGKSTTANFLENKALKTNDNEEIELVNPLDPTAMKISSGGVSETSVPQHATIGNLVYYDVPGFQDTRGLEIELANAAMIKHIIENAKNVRLMYVIGQDEITASRGSSAKELIESVQRLFPNTNAALDSSIIVVTKSIQNNSADLIAYLRNKMGNSNNVLESWLTPQKISPISKKINVSQRQEILNKIEYLSPVRIPQVNIEIIYNANLTTELKQIFSQEFRNILSEALKKGNGDISTIKGIESLQLYFAESFMLNILNDTKNSTIIKFLKPLSPEIYKVQEKPHLLEVKTHQASHQETLKFKKETLEREALIKQKEQEKEALERQMQEQKQRQKEEDERRIKKEQEEALIRQQQAKVAEENRKAEAAKNEALQKKLLETEQQRLIDQKNSMAEQQRLQQEFQQKQAAAEQQRLQQQQAAAAAAAAAAAEQQRLQQQFQQQLQQQQQAAATAAAAEQQRQQQQLQQQQQAAATAAAAEQQRFQQQQQKFFEQLAASNKQQPVQYIQTEAILNAEKRAKDSEAELKKVQAHSSQQSAALLKAQNELSKRPPAPISPTTRKPTAKAKATQFKK